MLYIFINLITKNCSSFYSEEESIGMLKKLPIIKKKFKYGFLARFFYFISDFKVLNVFKRNIQVSGLSHGCDWGQEF